MSEGWKGPEKSRDTKQHPLVVLLPAPQDQFQLLWERLSQMPLSHGSSVLPHFPGQADRQRAEVPLTGNRLKVAVRLAL